MITTIIHAFREFLGVSLEEYILADIIHQRQSVSPWVDIDTIRTVAKQLGLTPITITTGLKRLEKQHLIELGDSESHFRTTDLFNPLGFDRSKPPTQKPTSQSPPVTDSPDKPLPVNSAKDKNGEIIDLQKVMQYWNSLFGSNYKLTAEKRTLMRARFKVFTKAEILQALKARSTNSWHLEPGNIQHRKNFASFWRSDSKVEYFLIIKDNYVSTNNGLRDFVADERVP